MKHALSEAEVARLKNYLPDTAAALDELVQFGEGALKSKRLIKQHISEKDLYLLHAFAAISQRTRGIVACVRADQAVPATVILRSMWEIAVSIDFIYLRKDDHNLRGLDISDMESHLKAWTQMQRLRKDYPKAGTWRRTISDKKITENITKMASTIAAAKQQAPWYKPADYTLYQQMVTVDDELRIKNPGRRHLLQFDYRTVYHLFSLDTHGAFSGVLSTGKEVDSGIEVSLGSSGGDSMRIIGAAYSQYLLSLKHLLKRLKIEKHAELKAFTAKDKEISVDYLKLQRGGYIS